MGSMANRTGPQLYLKCEWCGKYFEYNGGKRKRWCTDAHKQAAWRSAGGVKIGSIHGVQINASQAVQSHECVAGFIYGVFDNGTCNQCGAKQQASV